MSDSLINNLRKGKNCEKKRGGGGRKNLSDIDELFYTLVVSSWSRQPRWHISFWSNIHRIFFELKGIESKVGEKIKKSGYI